MKFHGELSELKSCVEQLGYTGKWTEGNDNHVFRSDDGAVLNWWPSTGTIYVQGTKEPSAKLQGLIENWLEGGSLPDSTPSSHTTDIPADVPSPDVATIAPVSSEVAKRVFVVYGHDEVACEQLELVLRRLNLDPFVLGNTGGGGLTIIEALEKEIVNPGDGDRFGIVLLTPDDMGYRQGKDPSTSEPRARQNVVMEMGMLIAALGRPRVAILKKGHVEVPSDASGIIYLSFNNHVKEAASRLCQRLGEAGFVLSPDLVAKASS